MTPRSGKSWKHSTAGWQKLMAGRTSRDASQHLEHRNAAGRAAPSRSAARTSWWERGAKFPDRRGLRLRGQPVGGTTGGSCPNARSQTPARPAPPFSPAGAGQITPKRCRQEAAPLEPRGQSGDRGDQRRGTGPAPPRLRPRRHSSCFGRRAAVTPPATGRRSAPGTICAACMLACSGARASPPTGCGSSWECVAMRRRW